MNIIHHGDCLDVMRGMPDASVDAVVTDPPYELSFMGKGWDGTGIAFQADTWAEALRVLRPGGHLVAFGGTRTWHRLACAIEDAGFEVRDSLVWLYGQGFPKSLDVSKAIDKAAGAEGGRGPMKRGGERLLNQTTGGARDGGGTWGDEVGRSAYTYAPATDAARTWQGWGTALKPGYEPIVLARKPLSGTVAANVLAHGTGALNIDGCRIGFASDADEAESKGKNRHADYGSPSGATNTYGDYSATPARNYEAPGRWPANVILDDEAAAMLDEQSGITTSRAGKPRGTAKRGLFANSEWNPVGREHNDTGGASRFFYCPKATRKERVTAPDGTKHPTVKPLALMQWLCRLITPPGGTILDPFAGSGTTVEAALLEGFHCIAIEREATYLPLIEARLARHANDLPFDCEARRVR